MIRQNPPVDASDARILRACDPSWLATYLAGQLDSTIPKPLGGWMDIAWRQEPKLLELHAEFLHNIEAIYQTQGTATSIIILITTLKIWAEKTTVKRPYPLLCLSLINLPTGLITVFVGGAIEPQMAWVVCLWVRIQ